MIAKINRQMVTTICILLCILVAGQVEQLVEIVPSSDEDSSEGGKLLNSFILFRCEFLEL